MFRQSLIKMINNHKNSFKFSDATGDRRKKEDQIVKRLRQALNPTYLQVVDTTIGTSSCGFMYKILVESPLFIGKSKVQQHQMVSECLKDQLKYIHGFNLKTKIPSESQPKKQNNEEKIL